MKNLQSGLLLAYFKRKDGILLTQDEDQAFEEYRAGHPVEDAFNEEAFEQLARYQQQMPPVEQFFEKYDIPLAIPFPTKKQDSTVRVRRFPWRRLAVAASFLFVAGLAAWYFLLKEPDWNRLQTAKGEQRELMLPDGTKVWLNAATTLRYPEAFGKEVREVTLEEGEAYFEVRKDNTRPFIVNVLSSTRREGEDQDYQVKVLGTQFNVKAYREDSMVTTALVEGSVQVTHGEQSLVLKPGQQVIIDRQENVNLSAVDLSGLSTRKYQYFIFQNKRLSEIMTEVERWYDVEVIYLDPLNDERFIVEEFPRSEPLERLLSNLEATRVAHFKMKGRKVYISK